MFTLLLFAALNPQQAVTMRIKVVVPVYAPTGFAASVIPRSRLRRLIPFGASRQVVLRWKPSTDLKVPAAAGSGYRIYRSTSATGKFLRISSGFVSSCLYRDRSVRHGVKYWYFATALIRAGESKPSNVITIQP